LIVSRIDPVRVEQSTGPVAALVLAGAFSLGATVYCAVLRSALLFRALRGSLADSPQLDDIAHVRTCS
jgi:hypothetical protein